MSAASTATGLPYPGPPPTAPDPIRAAVAAYREAKESGVSELHVRMFGESAFADGGPNFDIDAYDEVSALGDAVADLSGAAAAPTLAQARAQRKTALRAKVFAGRNT
jgi:hypothetical protein